MMSTRLSDNVGPSSPSRRPVESLSLCKSGESVKELSREAGACCKTAKASLTIEIAKPRSKKNTMTDTQITLDDRALQALLSGYPGALHILAQSMLQKPLEAQVDVHSEPSVTSAPMRAPVTKMATTGASSPHALQDRKQKIQNFLSQMYAITRRGIMRMPIVGALDRRIQTNKELRMSTNYNTSLEHKPTFMAPITHDLVQKLCVVVSADLRSGRHCETNDIQSLHVVVERSLPSEKPWISLKVDPSEAHTEKEPLWLGLVCLRESRRFMLWNSDPNGYADFSESGDDLRWEDIEGFVVTKVPPPHPLEAIVMGAAAIVAKQHILLTGSLKQTLLDRLTPNTQGGLK